MPSDVKRTSRSQGSDTAEPEGPFAVGSRVVYPSHGVARIVRREKRTFNDEVCSYLVLELPARGWATTGGMVLSVPEASAVEIGVRHAISDEEAAEVIELLEARNVHVPTNWSRRFKNHQEKLKSGDVYECAEVVRNLALRSAKARLSAGEQAMYVRARTILTSELAVSWDTDEDGANARIDEALGLTKSSDAAHA